MNDFEELAHHSAASARASVSHLPIPPIPGHSNSRHVLRVGAVVAVTLGLITGLIYLSNGGSAPTDVAGGPDTWPSGSSPADSTPYFEFGGVPEGWVLTVSEGPNNSTVSTLASMTLAYGTGTAGDPFADADLMVSVVEQPPTEDLGPTVSDELLVRGHPAERPITDLADQFISIYWMERPDLVIALQSRRYGVDELVRIADSLSVDGFEVTLSNPPDGMSLVSSVGATKADLALHDGIQHLNSWTMTIADPESDSRVVLGTFAQRTGLFDLVRYANPNTVDVAVRDTAGVLESMGPNPDPQLVESLHWIENDQAMRLLVIGPDDPVAEANSLRRITRARFDELLAAYPAPRTPVTLPPTTLPPPALSPPDPEGPPGPAVTIAVP